MQSNREIRKRCKIKENMGKGLADCYHKGVKNIGMIYTNFLKNSPKVLTRLRVTGLVWTFGLAVCCCYCFFSHLCLVVLALVN